ncbi:peptidylprolyl isomerase [Sediminibacillus massiliensis]|uniref:peptidylprolyl isomerase n=1 Tax=Sediminibacillus massiliensis TaxID=1926277 RepID=UPI0009887FD0|nr:peptidylprolyl isomerase [Sediminibacillus massiliensis]
MKLVSKIQLVAAGLFILLLAAACGSTETEEQPAEDSDNQSNQQVDYPEAEENPEVTITMEDGEEIMIELLPEAAPNTVANFISLVEDGFYDGLIFHRVIPGFMIQGGDPEGTGMGGPGYQIPGEFSANGFENNVKHERGVVSMARSQQPDSAGSQFFIVVEDAPHLDEQYAAFGRVTEGMETVDEIVSAERDNNDKPLNGQQIKQVTVDTKGYDYPEPKKTE